MKSISGYTIILTNIPTELTEDELIDGLTDIGLASLPVTVTIPVDRRTGFTSGHALVVVDDRNQAQVLVDKKEFTIKGNLAKVDWAFIARSGKASH